MKDKDCYCFTCDKEFHHLGICKHRSMHRDKKQDCKIRYSTGKIIVHYHSDTSIEEFKKRQEADKEAGK